MKSLAYAVVLAASFCVGGQPPCPSQVCPDVPCYGQGGCGSCVCAVPYGTSGPGVCVSLEDEG
jgi:hypothetical protein